MTIMAEGTDSAPLNLDPRGIRPRLIYTISVMMYLTMRPDLPIVPWDVHSAIENKPGTDEAERCPTLRGVIPAQGGEANERAALRVWARAFDAEVTEKRHLSHITGRSAEVHATIRFYCRGVPVVITAVIDPREAADQ